MTLNPNMDNDCTVPPSNHIFYDHDEGAYFWFYVNAASIGDEIRVEWHEPNGSLYTTQSMPYNHENGCWNPGILISGHQAEYLPGNWRVSVYYDGDRYFSDYITIVDTSPDESITCPLSLIYGNDSLQTNALRSFRDTVLSKTPEGREIISLYYQCSPAIMKAMEGDKEFKQKIKGIIESIAPMIEGGGTRMIKASGN